MCSMTGYNGHVKTGTSTNGKELGPRFLVCTHLHHFNLCGRTSNIYVYMYVFIVMPVDLIFCYLHFLVSVPDSVSTGLHPRSATAEARECRRLFTQGGHGAGELLVPRSDICSMTAWEDHRTEGAVYALVSQDVVRNAMISIVVLWCAAALPATLEVFTVDRARRNA